MGIHKELILHNQEQMFALTKLPNKHYLKKLSREKPKKNVNTITHVLQNLFLFRIKNNK